MILRSLVAAFLGLLLLSSPAGADFAPSAFAPPREKAEPMAVFRALPTAASTRFVALDDADVAAIDKARADNSRAGPKRVQIGIARRIPEAAGATTDALSWQPAAGGWVAHLEIRSPGAKALRLGLVASRVTPRVEVRLSGSARPGVVYGPFTAADLFRANPIHWSPVLEGERATLEVFVGAGGTPDDVALGVVRVSHLFVSPSDPAVDRLAKSGSGACEVDLICRSATDPALANAGKAVARMTFVDGGVTYLCTGTLLNPTNGPFAALFYTANHCVGTQAVADTLTTLWFYDRPGCNSGAIPSGTQLAGGATLLYANFSSDGALLRLNALPPDGAVYAGWDSTTLAFATPLTGIHHPAGDWKKVSLATVGGFGTPGAGYNSGGFVVANWLGSATGVTEGGSSGSGIFTAVGSPATDYRLRGGLWGGASFCGAPPAALNDYYSRFDQVFPSIATFLNAPNTAGTVQLTMVNSAVDESAGSAILEVTRTGGASGGIFVNYATTAITATAGPDFTAMSGSLYWGPGDSTSKTITVPIIRDAVAEPTELFAVTLSNPRGGAKLGANAIATVAILDPGPWPPNGLPPEGYVQPAGAAYGWIVATDSASEDGYSLKSAMPPGSPVGTRAAVEMTATTGAGTMRFARRVSGTNPVHVVSPGVYELYYDGLLFFIDGQQMCPGDYFCPGFDPRSGEVAWGEESYLVAAGTHTFRWEYVKNNPYPCTPDATFTCADTAWIDTVRFPPGALTAAGDFDGDGIPNAIEAPEGRNPYYKDNDVFSLTATGARLFAMQQYRDFLGREGDTGGIAYYVSQLTGGAMSRAMVAQAFFNSPEFQDSGAAIVRLYAAFFGRIPDHDGFVFQASALKSGQPLGAIANNFSLSPEFVATYGALTDSQYVALLYQNVLGRAPVQAEIDYHVARLAAGVTRGEVMIGFSESPEYRTLKGVGVYVAMMYEGLLRRAADMDGFMYWVTLINNGMPGLNLVQGFIDSVEYHARFLP